MVSKFISNFKYAHIFHAYHEIVSLLHIVDLFIVNNMQLHRSTSSTPTIFLCQMLELPNMKLVDLLNQLLLVLHQSLDHSHLCVPLGLLLFLHVLQRLYLPFVVRYQYLHRFLIIICYYISLNFVLNFHGILPKSK